MITFKCMNTAIIPKSGRLLCNSIRFESPFEGLSKHDSIKNYSYNSTLKCSHVNYILFKNRYVEKLYDSVQLVFDFESLTFSIAP